MNLAEAAGIAIHPLKSWDEFLAAEELQRTVWMMPDWRDAVPANLLVATHKNGGLVLGAFEDAQLVGLVFSFLAEQNYAGTHTFKHHSHMLAVLPEYQARKIGARLKWVQRDLVLAQSLPLITWTYDPLLALNARLNLAHLGAIARQYLPNAYGEMTDGLNAGLESDRFQIEWWLDAPRVRERANSAPRRAEWSDAIAAHAQFAFDLGFDSNHLPHIERVNELNNETVLIEIPANLAAVKAADLALAREWRAQTRAMFQHAFAAGYIAVDLITLHEDTYTRAAYWLTRQPVALA
jgi:predicted GNAT superfamily acetyltransferase